MARKLSNRPRMGWILIRQISAVWHIAEPQLFASKAEAVDCAVGSVMAGPWRVVRGQLVIIEEKR